MDQQKKTKLIATIVSVGTVLVAAAVLLGLYFGLWAPKPEQGTKTVTVEIVIDDETVSFSGKTDANYLINFLYESKTRGKLTFESEVGEWGEFIKSINGRVANSASEYFAIYENGEYAQVGVSSIPLKDGFTYKFVLETFTV